MNGDRGDRGQSELIGVVLLLSITVIGATAVVAVGATVLADSQSDSQVSQIENSMSQMASKMSLVALGDSGSQTFDLGDIDDGSVAVDENAGHVTITHTDENDTETELYSEPYGAVVTTVDGTEVAYQGGGVWKKEGDTSRMISPPEYHYQQQTLTFPIVHVAGDDRASGSVGGSIERSTAGEQIYPTEEHENPLDNGTVHVTIQSEYYEGWYQFFKDRSDGEIGKYDGNNTVVVDLQVPFETTVSSGISVVNEDGYNPHQNADAPDQTEVEKGVVYPGVSDRIDNKIDYCDDSENCEALKPDEQLTSGTYNSSTDVTSGHLDIDTSGGDVDIVVDGDFSPDGIEIEGGNQVNVFLNGDMDPDGGSDYNINGNPEDLIIFVHEDIDSMEWSGNADITAIFYAPDTVLEITGNVNYKGAVVSDEFEIGSAAMTFDAEELDEDFDLDFSEEDVDHLTYLHVTENEVEVKLD